MIHDGRFDAAERLELIERERVACSAWRRPSTAYRRASRASPVEHCAFMVAAGEALDPEP